MSPNPSNTQQSAAQLNDAQPGHEQTACKPSIIARQLGIIDYQQCLTLMQQAIQARLAQTQHELWIVEHPSVMTQGQAGKPYHLLTPGHIACVQSDRGGQITYHGPGQLVCYFLFDLKRLQLNVKQLVSKAASSIIDLLKNYNIHAIDDEHSPGVYINQQKIASLGFRIRKHMSYHGIALNVDMDLTPFQLINPCGRQQAMTQLAQFPAYQQIDKHQLIAAYISQIAKTFAFDSVIVTTQWPQ